MRICFSAYLTVGGTKIPPLSSRNPGSARVILPTAWSASNASSIRDELESGM